MDATPKAIEILCLLIESDGRVVSKDEIISRVWPDSFVEEANLSHHIFRLRRALGENDEQKFIETIPKRGYRFVSTQREPADAFIAGSALERFPHDDRPFRSVFTRAMIPIAVVSAIILAASGIYLGISRFGSKVEKVVTRPEGATKASMSITPVTTSGNRGSATISSNGRFIAYAQTYASGEGVLYLRQTDTNAEIKLLEGSDRRFAAIAFSPDNEFLYFVLVLAGEPQTLYRIPVLGGQPIRMATDLNYFFTLSGGGDQAAFYRTNKELKQTSIVTVALDGSGSEKVLATFNDLEKSVDSVPAFSPDGKTIIFGLADTPDAVDKAPERVGLFSLSVADGTIKSLSEEKWMGIGMMNWMPNASGVVFVAYRSGTKNQLHFVSFPSGELRQITNELSGYSNYGMGITADGKTMVADVIQFSSQIWSSKPDGRTRDAIQITTSDQDGGQGLTLSHGGEMLYTSRTGADYDIWTLRKRGEALEAFPVTDDSSNDVEPVPTRDGRSLVFVSDRSGTRHVYLSNIDGLNPRQLTFGEGVDSNPDITPDDEWIVYASQIGNERRIWKIPRNGGTPVRVTDFESVAPSISPDGKTIVCIRPAENEGSKGSLEIVYLADGTRTATFGGVPFDWYYIPPKWTPDGRSIVYRRTDIPVGNLWKQDLTGGEPRQFTDFTDLKLYNFAFTRDGKKLVTSRGTIKVDVVLLKNFL